MTCSIRIIICALIMTSAVNAVFADTIELRDGTFLVGKVIEWDSYHIIFKNSHGAFAIRKDQLTRLYITDSKDEDIRLKDKLGHSIDDESIGRHYRAGSMSIPFGGIDRERLQYDIHKKRLGIDITAGGSYYFPRGDLAEKLDSGSGINLSLSRSLGWFLPDEYSFHAPLIQLEGEYLLFTGEETEIRDYSFFAGPRWNMGFPGGRWGSTWISLLGGMSVLLIEDEDYSAVSKTLSFKCGAGYEYKSGDFSAGLGVSWLYIYDRDIPLRGAGISIFGGYSF